MCLLVAHSGLCFDLDSSWNVFGLNLLWVGPHRSRLRSLEQVGQMCRRVCDSPFLRVAGVMGYEAAVAGLCESVRPPQVNWEVCQCKMLCWVRGSPK